MAGRKAATPTRTSWSAASAGIIPTRTTARSHPSFGRSAGPIRSRQASRRIKATSRGTTARRRPPLRPSGAIAARLTRLADPQPVIAAWLAKPSTTTWAAGRWSAPSSRWHSLPRSAGCRTAEEQEAAQGGAPAHAGQPRPSRAQEQRDSMAAPAEVECPECWQAGKILLALGGATNSLPGTRVGWPHIGLATQMGPADDRTRTDGRPRIA